MPWVDRREIEILDIMDRLYPLTLAGSSPLVVTLGRNPVGEIEPADMPAIHIFEGPDVVKGQSGSNSLGPQKRLLNLIFEMWVYSNDDDLSVGRAMLRDLYNSVRILSMKNKGLTEKSLTSVFNSPTPGILGIGMNTELQYINDGN